MKQFMDCAIACREAKLEQRSTDAASSKPTAAAPLWGEVNKEVEKLLSTSPERVDDTEMDDEYAFYRQGALREVYQAFDLDSNGGVGGPELMNLGKARNTLGQRERKWTEPMNNKLMQRIGTDRNGNTSEVGFVYYFNETLSKDPETFEQEINDFMECADECRRNARPLGAPRVERQSRSAMQSTPPFQGGSAKRSDSPGRQRMVEDLFFDDSAAPRSPSPPGDLFRLDALSARNKSSTLSPDHRAHVGIPKDQDWFVDGFKKETEDVTEKMLKVEAARAIAEEVRSGQKTSFQDKARAAIAAKRRAQQLMDEAKSISPQQDRS